MKKIVTIFFRVIIIGVAVATLILMIRFPLTEGRARNLDLFSIYSDPFILYGYAASIVFLIGLYKAFRLLGYIGQNKTFSQGSVKAVRNIKYCAIWLCVFIVMAGLYIRIFHNKDDDPAGFLAICMVTVFVAAAVAVAAARFERIVRNAGDKKENFKAN